jgi:signal transduction histidine kinase
MTEADGDAVSGAGVAGAGVAARFVVADDTPEIRALLRLILNRHGYTVVGEAANGAEAVALAQEHQPDVVIVDLAMPVMDGLEAIPYIRQGAPRAKVVVFSAFRAEQMEAEALAAGAHAYMEKGLPPAEVLATVARVMSVPEPPGVVGLTSAGDELTFVVHELLSPLTVIEGFSALIEAGGEGLSMAEVRDYAARVGRSAAHLRAVIQSVADARRVDGGTFVVEPSPIDLSALVVQTVADLASVVAPHPVAVDVRPGVFVEADAVRVRQVLTNLLSNAAKFSPADGPIEVGLARVGGGGWVEVWVADQGPGVPPERAGELFGRFARLGSPAPGMGIGLYISRAIARAHRGDLVLAPSGGGGSGGGGSGGGGARFVLRLPA